MITQALSFTRDPVALVAKFVGRGVGFRKDYVALMRKKRIYKGISPAVAMARARAEAAGEDTSMFPKRVRRIIPGLTAAQRKENTRRRKVNYYRNRKGAKLLPMLGGNRGR